jgi:lysyl-tRNA synthetase class 2
MTKNNDVITSVERDSSQEHVVRVEKVEEMRAQGIEPWPAVKPVNSNTAQILQDYALNPQEKDYQISGRVMSLRGHGKSTFANIQDATGKIQIYLKEDVVGAQKFAQFSKFIDIGDIVWVDGTSFVTKAGEATLRVKDFTLMSKCLHPLPDKFHGLEDVEVRYRQRYLDLITNEENRSKFKKRSKVVSAIRRFLENNDYLEVETPMLHPIPGGAAAKPFVTHHNALSSDFYLRIAPELYLKRLSVGGFERVFEINRNFRNEGISTRHNPEFTMLEFYTANKDYIWAMDFVEQIFKYAIQDIGNDFKLPYGNHELDFSKPFERISIRNTVLKYGKLTESDISPENIDKVIKEKHVKLSKTNMSQNEKIYSLFEGLVEHQLIQPTFVTDFPIEVSPLSKRDSNNPDIAARFELFIGGIEISNGFNELNDPFDQADRFKQQSESHAAGDEEAHHYDADYILSLEYALSPTVGVGIGIDRMVMLLTNTTSIKDIILFPTLKKK